MGNPKNNTSSRRNKSISSNSVGERSLRWHKIGVFVAILMLLLTCFVYYNQEPGNLFNTTVKSGDSSVNQFGENITNNYFDSNKSIDPLNSDHINDSTKDNTKPSSSLEKEEDSINIIEKSSKAIDETSEEQATEYKTPLPPKEFVILAPSKIKEILPSNSFEIIEHSRMNNTAKIISSSETINLEMLCEEGRYEGSFSYKNVKFVNKDYFRKISNE